MQASARSALAASGSERWRSALAVALIHLALGAALLAGLGVKVVPRNEPVIQLVDLVLDRPPPPPPITPPPAPVHREQGGAAPRAPSPAPSGGSPGPVKRAAPPAPAPLIILNPVVAGGGSIGTGQTAGSANGGGTGGNGTGNGVGDGAGDGEGGTDPEQIAGEIRPSDYPRAAREARVSGRVEFRFTVGTSGRVTACAITRSSGSIELDETTCRLVTQRFRYRPGTDARGRPIAGEVEADHLWQTGRW